MERTIIILVVVLVIVVGAYYLVVANNSSDQIYPNSTTTSSANDTGSSTVSDSSLENVTVNISNFVYSPSPLTVKKGTKVIWINNDSVQHDVVSVLGDTLKSPLLSQGQAFNFVFNDVGTYDYYCTIHPNMKGAVIVTD
jgi:amicyanin